MARVVWKAVRPVNRKIASYRSRLTLRYYCTPAACRRLRADRSPGTLPAAPPPPRLGPQETANPHERHGGHRDDRRDERRDDRSRSEEHTSDLQSLMRIS